MIGEPLEAWHAQLAKMPVTIVRFEWNEERGLPRLIVLDIEAQHLSAALIKYAVKKRRAKLQLILNNFGHGLGSRLFSVGQYMNMTGTAPSYNRHLFTTGSLHNLVVATASKISTLDLNND